MPDGNDILSGFWEGYSGQPQNQSRFEQGNQPVRFYYSGEYRPAQTKQPANVPGVYDKSKLIKMRGPNGEEGTIYADGKMYIIFPGGKAQKRTFPSRPWGIRYMQKRGWVLV
jgi:hypothetical protein